MTYFWMDRWDIRSTEETEIPKSRIKNMLLICKDVSSMEMETDLS
jgi:hypothetical protein